MWFWFLVGFLCAQLICFIVLVATHQNEEATIVTGCGLILGPVNLVILTIKGIYRWYVRKAYIVVCIQTTDTALCQRNARIKPKWYNDYYHEGENESYIEYSDVIVSVYNIPNYPNLRHVNDGPILNQKWIKDHILKRS